MKSLTIAFQGSSHQAPALGAGPCQAGMWCPARGQGSHLGTLCQRQLEPFISEQHHVHTIVYTFKKMSANTGKHFCSRVIEFRATHSWMEINNLATSDFTFINSFPNTQEKILLNFIK